MDIKVSKDKMIDGRKRSKTKNEVKPVENINKNQLNFLEIDPVQKEVLRSCKIRPCIWVIDSVRVKGRKPLTDKLTEWIKSSKFVSIKQECQETLIQGKIHIQQNWNEDLEY